MKTALFLRLSLLLFVVIMSSSTLLLAQNKTINVKYVEHNDFEIDGVLKESIWSEAEVTTGFHEWFPTDTREGEYQTEISMLYNEDYLYIGIKAYAPGTDYKTPSYQRDFSLSGADIVNLMFDTYSDRTNAFLFGINSFGVHREGLISNGGITGNLDLSWDTKWLGESTVHDTYSISEIRIPMSSFKFKEGVKSWKFNSMRSDTQSNTKSSWSRVPQNQDQLNLGYYGDMVFEKPLGKSKSPISFIPYVTPSFTKDGVEETQNTEISAGFDVKVPVANSFMLDLTVNPDFSSADVAAGQNNTTRFEIKQDETRQFFIDNGDLFNGFGLEEDALAFYSRRIGVGEDLDSNTVFVPINAGAKFTGKISNKLRIGALNVQTGGNEKELIPSNNNMVLAVEQKIFKKSNIGFFFINRQVTNPGKDYSGTLYNRVAGTDLQFYSKNNDLDAKVFIHKSMTPGIHSNAISSGTDINLEKRKYTLSFYSQYIDEGFQSDLGFIKRKDIVRMKPFAEYKMYPESKLINTIIVNANNNAIWKVSDGMKHTDNDLIFTGKVNFTSGAAVGAKGSFRYVYLDKPFDPIGGNDQNVPLPIGDYYTQDVELNYNSDRRKALWFEGYTTYGGFYSGTKLTSDATIQYRYQPYFYVALNLTYDNIELPEPHASASLWYLGPVFNFTFTKTLFWNTDIQYSTQSKDMLVNSRLQWRFAPLSDVFLTYTSTYDTSPFNEIRQGLYLRVAYWLDIKGRN